MCNFYNCSASIYPSHFFPLEMNEQKDNGFRLPKRPPTFSKASARKGGLGQRGGLYFIFNFIKKQKKNIFV